MKNVVYQALAAKKKFWSLLLIWTVNATMMTASPVTINEIVYELDEQNRTAEVVQDMSAYLYKKNIDIPASISYKGQTYDVTCIGMWAFKGMPYLESVTIPNSVIEIKYCAFKSCHSLLEIVIPNSVRVIGNDAFDYCTELRSIVLPDSLKTINSRVFANCYHVQHFYLPACVDSIGDLAFFGCRMTEFTCYATTPPAMGNTVFGGQAKNAFLYVPVESVELYKAADQWKEFKFIEPIETPENVKTPRHNNPQSVKHLQNGQILILRGDKTYTITGQKVQ